jgi:hypothetical protein
MSALNQEANSNLPANIYYDLLISNFDNGSQQPNAFHYNMNGDDPFLENPEAYELSIIKFQIDTGLAPVAIPSIARNQPDVNLTIYSVKLSATADDGSVVYSDDSPVMWVPQDETSSIPQPTDQTSDGFQDNNSGYYYCYNYTYFNKLVQTAYDVAFANLKTKTATMDTALAPMIFWDSPSDTAVFYVPEGSPYSIVMNSALFNMYNSFPFTLTNQGYKLVVNTVVGLNTQEINTITYTVVQQEGSSLIGWSPFTAIVFSSNTLPVQSSMINNPRIYSNNSIVSQSAQSVNENIITDLTSSDGQYKGGISYVPSAQYRKITLFGNRPQRNMDLNIYYRTKFGKLLAFRLSSGGSITLKLLFEKIKH